MAVAGFFPLDKMASNNISHQENNMDPKIYVCDCCGEMLAVLKDAGIKPVCCASEMKTLEIGTIDASREKHVPVVTVEGNLVTVNVGSAAHPMTEEHLIEWVMVQTSEGRQRKNLAAGCAPEVKFALTDGEKLEGVYAYCNLHGLWKAEI